MVGLIPVLVGVSVLVFALMHLTPGDPVMALLGTRYTPEAAAQLRAELHLDESLVQQYVSWAGALLQGDLGTSLFSRTEVSTLLLNALPVTLQLALAGMLFAIAVGVPLGILAAVKPGGAVDRVGRMVALVTVSVPVYWFGLVLIAIFAVRLGWLPSGGGVADYGLQALVLPSIAVGSGFVGIVSRTTRASMLEALSLPFVQTARSKGLSSRRTVLRHVLPNALLPIVTVSGLQFGTLLGGAVLTETVFALPGVGRLLIESVTRRDFPVLQGCVLLTALGFVIVNFITDMLYGALDPRVRRPR